jgi:Ni,Fe-hydrogenase I large subunit
MWRGIEVILKGRDPRDAWAFVQRICGVCTGTHALTSVRCVEDALGIQIPENANSIRNIMQLTLQVHDHLVHFYHLHALDWVNPVNALKADIAAAGTIADIETYEAERPSEQLACRVGDGRVLLSEEFSVAYRPTSIDGVTVPVDQHLDKYRKGAG